MLLDLFDIVVQLRFSDVHQSFVRIKTHRGQNKHRFSGLRVSNQLQVPECITHPINSRRLGRQFGCVFSRWCNDRTINEKVPSIGRQWILTNFA